MLLAWDNKADAAAISAGSELATLPGSNVQQPHLSRRWGTAAAVKTSYVLLDMGAAIACALLAVLGTNLTSAATLRLRASTADPTAVAGDLLDTGTVAAGVKTGYGAIYKAFNSVTARYWRLDLTDNSVPDNLLVGRLFLGPSWDVTGRLIWDWGVTPVDESQRMKSRGGQSYPESRAKFRLLQFVLDYMTQAEAFGNAFALQRAAGVTDDVLGIPDITSAYVSEQSVWGLLSASEPIRNRAFGIHTQKFSIEERL